jgi:hypothetical protein
MLLAILRHPEVTRELFFTLNFDPPQQSRFVRDTKGSYHPDPATQIIGWLNRAANGARLQRVIERDGSQISQGVAFGDSYREVKGAVFVSAGQTTLILQNASSRARTYDPTDGGRRPVPKGIEVVVTPDLNDSQRRAVQVNSISGAGPFAVPGYSVVRVVWSGEIDVTR